ncbi:MAG: hypothetical protein AB8W35_03625 [Coxiella endosymbiont of Dermacentor nuttalli]
MPDVYIASQTVEQHIKNIYEKAEVYSANQLREFGKLKGFDRYIPANLLPHQRTQIFEFVGSVV